MGTSVSAFPCPCFCDIIRACESMNVPLSECKEIHFSVKSNRFQGHWINDAQHWLNLAQLAPFRIRKNAVSFALEISDEYDKTQSSGCRKPARESNQRRITYALSGA